MELKFKPKKNDFFMFKNKPDLSWANNDTILKIIYSTIVNKQYIYMQVLAYNYNTSSSLSSNSISIVLNQNDIKKYKPYILDKHDHRVVKVLLME